VQQSQFQNSLEVGRKENNVMIPFNFKTITADSSVYCLWENDFYRRRSTKPSIEIVYQPFEIQFYLGNRVQHLSTIQWWI